MPEAWPDFERLYAAVTGDAQLSEVHKLQDVKIKQLSNGLAIFEGPNAEAAAKFKRNEAVHLANEDSSATGLVGKAAACWEDVSKLLGLHEAQAVLLLHRWIEANVPKADAQWQPHSDQLRAICAAYFSQRWHLLLTLRYLISTAASPESNDQSAAAAILQDLQPDALLTSLLASAAGNYVSTGSAVAASAQSVQDSKRSGALQLHGAQEGLVAWREQAACELCCLQLCILQLQQTANADTPGLKHFADTLMEHALRPNAAVLQDCSSMHALAARLGIAIVLQLLDLGCVTIIRQSACTQQVLDVHVHSNSRAVHVEAGRGHVRPIALLLANCSEMPQHSSHGWKCLHSTDCRSASQLGSQQASKQAQELADYIASSLTEDASVDAAQSPALAPLLLATAAALESRNGGPSTTNAQSSDSDHTEQVDALSAAAESAAKWGNLRALLQHEGLHQGPERHSIGSIVFDVLGAVFDAFGVRLSALPAEDCEEVLVLLDDVVYGDAELARYASYASW